MACVLLLHPICTSDTSVERELLSGLVAVPQRGCRPRTFRVAAGTHHVLVPPPGSRLQDTWVGPRLGLGMPGTARARAMVWTRTFASLGGHAGRQVQAELRSTLTPAPPTFQPGREPGARSLAFPVEGFPPALGRGAVFVPPSLAVCPLPRGFPHQGTGWSSPLLHSPGPTPGVCAGPGVTGAPACRGHVHTEPSPALKAGAASLYPSGLRA